MSPVINIIRVGKGRHHFDPKWKDRKDPPLSAYGINQARFVGNMFPHKGKIRRVFSSPMTRAIQTALEAFDPLNALDMPITVEPAFQVPSNRPSDVGSAWEDLVETFGLAVDASALFDDPDWFMNGSDTQGGDSTIAKQQAQKALRVIWEAAQGMSEHDHIVVIAHGSLINELFQGKLAIGYDEVLPCRLIDSPLSDVPMLSPENDLLETSSIDNQGGGLDGDWVEVPKGT